MSLTGKLNINLEEEPNSKVTFSDESKFLSYDLKRTWPTILTMTSGAEKLEVPVFARKAGPLYGCMI